MGDDVTPLPIPPSRDDLTWRPATTTDAQALADHTRRIHEVERLEALLAPDFFEWLLDQPGIDPDTDTLVAATADQIVADAGTWLHASDTGARCIVWAETSPGFGDLRPFLLTWCVARATERLGDISADIPRVIRVSAEEHRTGYRDAIEAAGFGSMRSFAAMARSLNELSDPGSPPDTIEVVGWSDDLEESTRIASNESFSDHWGSLPMTEEEFSGFYRTNPTFRPDLSYLAVADGRVVAFCLCEVDDDDNADRDTNDVFIQRVGTIASYRGQGLASHLIGLSMQRAASTGSLDRAALDVDEMSHTNATAVYERLGFETYARSLTYIIAV
jgi:ribosomal protein S18 acetylase RimI-like enzyme